MLLTKHDGVTFENQTVYISGQAFLRCKFVACTLILQETTYHLEECSFDRCNWHVNRMLLWGSPESLADLKTLVNLIEVSQKRLSAPVSSPSSRPATDGGAAAGEGDGSTLPFAT